MTNSCFNRPFFLKKEKSEKRKEDLLYIHHMVQHSQNTKVIPRFNSMSQNILSFQKDITWIWLHLSLGSRNTLLNSFNKHSKLLSLQNLCTRVTMTNNKEWLKTSYKQQPHRVTLSIMHVADHKRYDHIKCRVPSSWADEGCRARILTLYFLRLETSLLGDELDLSNTRG